MFVIWLTYRAIKNGKGLHSKKEVPIHRVADVSGVGIFSVMHPHSQFPHPKGTKGASKNNRQH